MSKVERVAAACRAAVEQAGKLERTVPFEEMSFLVARAAIEAMRRPNRDVLTAFVDDAVSVSDAAVRWEAAIDAALNEEG